MNKKGRYLNTLNNMFVVYNETCQIINKGAIKNMDQLCESSLQMLQDIFKQYSITKTENQNSQENFSQKQNFSLNDSIFLKFSQKQLQSTKPIIPQKKYFSSVKKTKSLKNKTLSQELEQINLLNDQIDAVSMNNFPQISQKMVNQLKQKSVSELISGRKDKIFQPIQEKIQQEQNQNITQYAITDHSSNSSSNDDIQYEAVQKYQQQVKPLFGGIFQKKKLEQKSLFNDFSFDKPKVLNFDLKTINLLKSPKKSPKKKRLYIRTKLIPKWAQDINKINCNENGMNPKQIFGECKVQNLDTNIIFKIINQNIQRTSSAQWNDPKKQQYEVLKQKVALQNLKLLQKKGQGIQALLNTPSQSMSYKRIMMSKLENKMSQIKYKTSNNITKEQVNSYCDYRSSQLEHHELKYNLHTMKIQIKNKVNFQSKKI